MSRLINEESAAASSSYSSNQLPAPDKRPSFDRVSIAFRWLTAILVLGLITSAVWYALSHDDERMAPVLGGEPILRRAARIRRHRSDTSKGACRSNAWSWRPQSARLQKSRFQKLESPVCKPVRRNSVRTASDMLTDKTIKRLTRRRNNRHLVGKDQISRQPGRKRRSRDSFGKRALGPHAWASVEARAESECESSSFLFDRTRRGFQRLVGNLKAENLFFPLDVLVSHRPSSSCSPSGAGITREVHTFGENPPPRNPLNHRLRTV